MRKIYQTKYGKPGGNCFQAAIASLFEIDLDKVPDFCNVYDTDTEEWYKQFIKWLNKRGFSSIPLEADDIERPNYKDCYLLVTGKNKNHVNHCVIYRNGEVVHNPNKNGKGIKPDSIDIIFPLNPAPAANERRQ